MSTYKEQQANKHIFVLVKDCEVLATFGNFRKLCDYAGISYNTYIRKKEYPFKAKDYNIFKVNHY